jgi:hypothetical protein
LGKKQLKKGRAGKNKYDFFNELGYELIGIQLDQRREFLQEIMKRPEGIAADKEKFIQGMQVGAHKVLPVNKKDEKFINKVAPLED